jgi:hypothetical protein
MKNRDILGSAGSGASGASGASGVEAWIDHREAAWEATVRVKWSPSRHRIGY